MVVGLVLVNIPYIEASNNPSLYGFGICCALFSLISWTWFAIESVKFLKTNPEVDSTSWSTLIGMATLVWVLLAYLILYLGFPETLHTDRYFTAHPEFLSLLGSSAVLGIICSWVGSAFWNKACLHIPISLAGQLLIFETLFGLAYVYLLASTYPVPIEFLGILFLLGGVTLGVMRFSKLKRVDSAP